MGCILPLRAIVVSLLFLWRRFGIDLASRLVLGLGGLLILAIGLIDLSLLASLRLVGFLGLAIFFGPFIDLILPLVFGVAGVVTFVAGPIALSLFTGLYTARFLSGSSLPLPLAGLGPPIALGLCRPLVVTIGPICIFVAMSCLLRAGGAG